MTQKDNMNNNIKEPYRLLYVALKHYSLKLDNLKTDGEIINGKLQKDIEDNYKKALEISDLLEQLMSVSTIQDNSKIICSALSVYICDLKNAKSKLSEKLGSGVNFEFTNTTQEIEEAVKIRENLCKD